MAIHRKLSATDSKRRSSGSPWTIGSGDIPVRKDPQAVASDLSNRVAVGVGFLFFCGLSSLTFAQVTNAQDQYPDEYRLEPIQVQGTPSDVWSERALYPAKSLSTQPLHGSGNIAQSFQESSGVPVTDGLRPGDKVQVRGFGFSAEETDVRVFGVSLNPALGGGFNFSVFPAFLWSEASYRQGLPTSLSGPMAVSGSLLMRPWSQSALEDESLPMHSRFAISSQKWTQASAGARIGEDTAFIAGMNLGEVEGPSGGLSSRLGQALGSHWTFHFLGSQNEGPNKGLPSFPTPSKRLEQTRIIPVLQRDARGGREKTTIFADWGKIVDSDLEDPSATTFNETLQVGLDQAWEIRSLGDTRIGLSGRYIDISKPGSEFPKDWSLTGQVSRRFVLTQDRAVTLEPQLAASVVRTFGVSPIGGVSVGFEKIGSVFRVSYFRKTPTPQNRYFEMSGWDPNPDLEPEKGVQLQWVTKVTRQRTSFGIEAFIEKRWDTVQSTGGPFPIPSTPVNSGSGYVMALLPHAEFFPTGWVTAGYTGSFSRSFVQNTRQPISGIPSFVHIPSISIQNPRHPRSLSPLWRVTQRMKGWGRVPKVGGGTFAGSWNLISEASFRLSPRLEFAVRVENWLERTITYQEGFPFSERVIAGGFTATF